MCFFTANWSSPPRIVYELELVTSGARNVAGSQLEFAHQRLCDAGDIEFDIVIEIAIE